VPPGTVRDILKRAGLDPAPRRDGPAWGQFLKAQAAGVWAGDLFHAGTVFLKRVYDRAGGVIHEYRLVA
jgi:hypothetical protein